VEQEGLLLVLLEGCGVTIVGEGVVECEAQVLRNADTLAQLDALPVRREVTLVVVHGLLEVLAVALGWREVDAGVAVVQMVGLTVALRQREALGQGEAVMHLVAAAVALRVALGQVVPLGLRKAEVLS
jgi:hypothetical protein